MDSSFPKDWQLLPLEDCMARIIDYRGKSPSKTPSGIPLVTAKIVKGGRILTPDEFIAPEEYDEWMRRGLPNAGDVIMTTEAPLGEVAQLDERKVALAQRLITLRGKRNVLDNTFLKFLMQSAFVQEQLRARATGTTVLGIRQSELRRVTLPIPTLEEQRAIARMLGALDKRIELNRTLSKTLEDTAKAIFCEYFIDARARNQTSKSRWKTGHLTDIVDLIVERVEATQDKDSDRYISLDDMPSRSIDLSVFSSGSQVNSSIIRFRKGDILFGSMRPYFHKVGLAQFDGITRTTTFVLRPKRDALRSYALFHVASDEVIAFSTTASVGTTIPYIKWEALRGYVVPIPDDEVLHKFESLASPQLALIAANGQQSRTLSRLRDSLLPKLLAGKLRIKQTDKTMEAAL